MRLLRIVPDDTKFDFMRFRRISFPMSALLSIVAIALYFHPGLNLGIDFRGGTLMEVQSKSGAADLARMRSTLGQLNLGDFQLARDSWMEAIQLFAAAGDVPGIVLQLDNLSALARHDGEFGRAARLWGAASALQESSGTGLGRMLREEEGRTGREGLDDDEAARVLAEGQAMSLEQAVAYALQSGRVRPGARHD